MGLPEVRLPAQGGQPLLLLQEQRPAEPKVRGSTWVGKVLAFESPDMKIITVGCIWLHCALNNILWIGLTLILKRHCVNIYAHSDDAVCWRGHREMPVL